MNNSLELNRTVRENLEYTKTINENLLFIKLDDDFSIVDVSDAFIKQSGHKKSNLLGEDYSILYDDKDLYTDMILNLLEDNSFNDTLISEKADGSQCHYKISVVCVKDKKGIVEGLLDIREDITDKIILEQQQETLFEQSKFNAMGSLLKDIAHQWRQPLNVISLQMEGLQITAETGDLDSEFIDMVYTQSQEQISYLTDIISSFSSYFSENGKDEEIDILRLLESTSKILAMYLEEKNIKIDISGKTFMTRGNKDKLSQVILNLINNSIESIEKKQEEDKQYQGTIIIRSFAELKKIEIVDNGIGVDEKIRDKIFDPYFTTKFKDRGVGLSLYLSKVIIEQNLGGKLGCLKFDDGASFYINF
ncbi:MAG: PAS domain-containing sensor histidine kinase [Campylobacterales bacterium]|nr:PAS domain-containing sensor histidine kinase [Campylobacterales bacterium]